MRLTNIQIRNIKPEKKTLKLSDGNNLYLIVTPVGSKVWYSYYSLDNKRRQIALGK